MIALLLATIIVGLPAALASDGFVYNEDAECSIPFLEASIVNIDCHNTNQAIAYQQQQQNGDMPEACYFGDEMMITGSFELNQKVNRYFSLLMDICYTGSSANAFYQPRRCKTYRRSIDMRNYVLMEGGNGDGDYEEENVKEGYNYQSYWQDEERQQQYEERQQAMAEQAEAEELYLYAGTYSFSAVFNIPQKSFAFRNGSNLQVIIKLVPRESFTIPYYSQKNEYIADNVQDSKYQTNCYLSFGAIPINLYNQSYRYYSMAGLGFLLLGAATIVSSRRRILCTCDDRDDSSGSELDYQNHIEISSSSSTVSTFM